MTSRRLRRTSLGALLSSEPGSLRPTPTKTPVTVGMHAHQIARPMCAATRAAATSAPIIHTARPASRAWHRHQAPLQCNQLHRLVRSPRPRQ